MHKKRYGLTLRLLNIYAIAILFIPICDAQGLEKGSTLKFQVLSDSGPVEEATVRMSHLDLHDLTDSSGVVEWDEIPAGNWIYSVSHVAYDPMSAEVTVVQETDTAIYVFLTHKSLDEIVVTERIRDISVSRNIIATSIIHPRILQTNATASLFDAMSNIGGIQPVIQCGVCNTGDFQINGMEGVYTQVLIDGMPIISGLGTVYGLMGIPPQMIERIELVTGPTGAMYGSDAMAGVINIITKNPIVAPRITGEMTMSEIGETTVDAGVRYSGKKNIHLWTGVSGYWFQNRIDRNGDNFTDAALQKRIAVFQKLTWRPSSGNVLNAAARWVSEERWGGVLNWNKTFKGSDQRYGEYIATHRMELLCDYRLPIRDTVLIQGSWSTHDQQSYYGLSRFDAQQSIGFIQMEHQKSIGVHHIKSGGSFRFNAYNDNTPATQQVSRTINPAVFIQDEWTIPGHHHLLTGLRLDYHQQHGFIVTPRLGWHYHVSHNQNLRISIGRGFRTVHVFTEDHAALSGARDVVFEQKLKPESAWSAQAHYDGSSKWKLAQFDFNVGVFYYLFTNKIIPDYDTDPNLIIYNNLDGHAVSRGGTFSTTYLSQLPVTLRGGVTFMDVYVSNFEGIKTRQIKAPMWTGQWSASYDTGRSGFIIDLTGNWVGRQRMPVFPNDHRPSYAPDFAIANLRIGKTFSNGVQIFIGVKNIFDFLPKDPILRPHDPFDHLVNDPIDNPNGFTFDTTYTYASMLGRRWYAGIRFQSQR